jgi:hypothetical protein
VNRIFYPLDNPRRQAAGHSKADQVLRLAVLFLCSFVTEQSSLRIVVCIGFVGGLDPRIRDLLVQPEQGGVTSGYGPLYRQLELG